jgi:DNA adenine methylase
MVNHICQKCGKEFKQKGHLARHENKKIPCVNVNFIDNLVQAESEKKLNKVGENNIPQTQTQTQTQTQSQTQAQTQTQTQTETQAVTNKPLNPIVKWSGGKSDEIKSFIDYIPNDIDTYLEPFIGGGAVYFYLKPKKAAFSDVHEELIDFYKAIANNKGEEIYNFMSEHPNEEAEYYKIRDEFEINSPLDNAKRFYYLRKTCYRGMLRYNKKGKFNIPFGRYKTYNYEEVKNPEYYNLLKNTDIHLGSFEHLFQKYNDKKNFMFLDPPYDSEFTDYGYCTFDKEKQKQLAQCFKTTKIRCLMIIGKTEFISNLYKDYIVGEYDKKYRFKLHSGRIGDEINTKHLIIKNY